MHGSIKLQAISPQPEQAAGAAYSSGGAPAVATKGIAILGSNPLTVGLAPFGDPAWRIYACSPDNTPHGMRPRPLPRVDQWFEVHDQVEDPTRPYAYIRSLEALPIVWMRDKRAVASGLFKGARLYPEAELKGTSQVQEIREQNPDGVLRIRQVEVPNNDGLFCATQFTSSIAFMLAKAIIDCEAEGIKKIGVWGVMQQSENEYVYQRPGIQYFLWEAGRRGIGVTANRESCLFDMPQWKW
jgi:hypothetical protein